MLGLGVARQARMAPNGITIFNIPLASPTPSPARSKTAVRKVTSSARAQPAPPLPKPRFERPLDMLVVSREDYRAMDIANLPRRPTDAAEAAAAANDSEAIGRGPSGQLLYAAEWARRPTDAELGGYLPQGAPDGWGLIACRTVAGHRVEDCVEIDNYPRGSRLAGAVRQAAWQFRVRPPRKNGREMVGEWVQIRIEYIRRPRG